MKVFIPFNSNDFNSIFTTLSISPKSFYPKRGFSFKRASGTYLNNDEKVLIGYQNPIFHNKDKDLDEGVPILLEININKSSLDFKTDQSGLRYVLIDYTLYLMDDFKLYFRSQKELDETLFKSLKSIETKFVSLAKLNSIVIEEDYYINQIPQLAYSYTSLNFSKTILNHERKLNKVLGLILGSSIACSYSTSEEFQEILILLRILHNEVSIYLNDLNYNNISGKMKLTELIEDISKKYENIEKFSEVILLNSNITSDLFVKLKNSEIFGVSTINLLVEGLLTQKNLNLPLSLRLEKLKRKINTRPNAKLTNNYTESVINYMKDISLKVEDEVKQSRGSNHLNETYLVNSNYIDSNTLRISLPKNLTDKDKQYLEVILHFFLHKDTINDIEALFTNRKNILIELATHLKSNIIGFEKSKERDYLLQLLKAFDNPRNAFKISTIDNEVIKSIAILFTSGRDLFQFIEMNEKERIQTPLIYYTLWGSIYGAASLPKTLTEFITENTQNLQTFMVAYRNTISSYLKSVDTIASETLDASIGSDAIVSEFIQKDNNIISILGNEILEKIRLKSKIKLSELVKLSKIFKKQTDVEEFIKLQLDNKIKISKNGKSLYAEEITDKNLFN